MTSVIAKKVSEIKAKTISMKSYWLMLDEMRLDASFYAEDVATARRFLDENGYSIVPLETFLKDVFYPPRSKRYLTDRIHGIPYLTASEFSYFQPKPKFIIGNKISRIENWYVKEGWILLSRSGTVGIPMLVTERFESYVFSEHLIRLVPNPDATVGFIYAYQESWLGQALITKDQFGAVVKEIEPHHVKSLPIPNLPKEIQRVVHKNILKVFRLRDEARSLLDKSQEVLLQELAIPKIEHADNHVKVFSVRVSDLRQRFDASFHDESVAELQNQLEKGKYPIERIGNNIGNVFIPPRFKRIYVEKEYGVPFLSGTNIAEVKLYTLKYLSRKATKNLEKWIIHSNWVLITCSGTIGRVALTPKEWDGWAASQHVLRIIPNRERIHHGYLVAFLMSAYGYDQVTSKIYGGVVDELNEDDVRDVIVPVPPMDVQERIGKLVVKAFELKELANKIEDETVRTLENMLEEHRKVEVNEEYLKEINSYVDSFELVGNEEFQETREELESGETISFDEFKKEHGF